MGDDFLGDGLREVAGDRAGKSVADFVDADDFALEVHEWSARVAAVDSRVMGHPAHQCTDVFTIEAEH